ncbi:MAG: P-loop NTPase [Gemmatimonadota bacterium]|nr:P-loop NTPase [Gemmatimonadota bacterium]MDQ8169063.1 P-loop NTPase [Gemmatimonadota bacterium]MDQ8173901.1 P-loop NTPase [Gemmatimonadota bacterium]
MTNAVMPEARTVLVVGDADAPRDTTDGVLTERGFRAAEHVDTLAAAATRLRSESFDLVILPIGGAGPKEMSLIEHDIRPSSPFIIGTAAGATQELILGALRAGIPEFVPAPLNPEELDVAVRRLVRRMEPALRTRGKIIAVYSAKGGLGTTTVAVNVATAIAREHTDERVALVDFVVVGGDVRVVLDLKPSYDIGDLVMKVDRIDGELLSSLMTPGPSGMLVLPSSDRPEVQDLIESNAASAILSQLRAHFNYVVLDLEHYLGERTIGALDTADRIVLVTQLSVPALRSTQRTLNLFNRLGYAPAKVAVVVNRANAESPLTIGDAETVLGRAINGKLPNDFTACADATTKGIPVLEHEPNSSLANSYRHLAANLVGTPEAESAAANGTSNGAGDTDSRKRRLYRLGRS